jgi:hypothetical protein
MERHALSRLRPNARQCPQGIDELSQTGRVFHVRTAASSLAAIACQP